MRLVEQAGLGALAAKAQLVRLAALQDQPARPDHRAPQERRVQQERPAREAVRVGRVEQEVPEEREGLVGPVERGVWDRLV